MSNDNPYDAPSEATEAEVVSHYEGDPSRGIVIEKFIALAIVLTMLVAVVAAVPRMLM